MGAPEDEGDDWEFLGLGKEKGPLSAPVTQASQKDSGRGDPRRKMALSARHLSPRNAEQTHQVTLCPQASSPVRECPCGQAVPITMAIRTHVDQRSTPFASLKR